MSIFDVLDELESYVPVLPSLIHVITVMDRSLPYEKGPGSYTCPEAESVTYQVDAVMTSNRGIPFTVAEGTEAVLVALEGEEIVSSLSGDEVFILTEGRFLVLSQGSYKRAVAVNLPIALKDVLFTFS